MPDASPCVCTALRKASRALTRRYDEHLADSGMTITQFALLQNIARAPDLPLSRLADELVMERTTLYRTLAPLERQGWLSLTTLGTTRVKTAALTDAGREAMQAAVPAWKAAQAEIVKGMGEADMQMLAIELRNLAALSEGFVFRC
ncbi:MarR family winged helix-turn-helix transcriptional regulator [Sphingomonas faeni]|uniref:MarR family winged helix-turn-helix transcriptional regulator n=1 Tax=Sphingomonas faeni TaxID=185950 RepID=UPI003363A698